MVVDENFVSSVEADLLERTAGCGDPRQDYVPVPNERYVLQSQADEGLLGKVQDSEQAFLTYA